MSPSTDETIERLTAPAGASASASADALEIFADVLAKSEEEALGDDFYSRLCEGITRCTAMQRIVIFRYDSARRSLRRSRCARWPRTAYSN
jgi:hypothetical protein